MQANDRHVTWKADMTRDRKDAPLMRAAAFVVLAILLLAAGTAAVLNIQEGMTKPTLAIIGAAMALGLLRFFIERRAAEAPLTNRWVPHIRNLGWGLVSALAAIAVMLAYAAGYLR